MVEAARAALKPGVMSLLPEMTLKQDNMFNAAREEVKMTLAKRGFKLQEELTEARREQSNATGRARGVITRRVNEKMNEAISLMNYVDARGYEITRELEDLIMAPPPRNAKKGAKNAKSSGSGVKRKSKGKWGGEV
jgi:hypothetical protein